MSRLRRWAAARRPEHAILGSPGRDTAVTAAAFAVVADNGIPAHIQRADDASLRFMVSGRAAPVTVIAKFFNLLGLVYVTLPVRIAIAGYLALRRRWWHMTAFVAAVVLSEVLIGTLKNAYDPTRPPVRRRRRDPARDVVRAAGRGGVDGLQRRWQARRAGGAAGAARAHVPEEARGADRP